MLEIKEIWIGGIHDWNQDQWKWATSGRKIRYNNFEKMPHFDQNDSLMCMALDPSIDYKWVARNCLQRNHFICETKPQPECTV